MTKHHLPRIFFLFLCFFFITTIAQAQSANDSDKVFKLIERPAQFPGGIKAWGQFLSDSLRYPAAAVKAKKGAKVRIQLTIDRDGSIMSAEALDHPGYGMEEEAIRVIKSSPKWIPAMQNGRTVMYRVIQAITFSL